MRGVAVLEVPSVSRSHRYIDVQAPVHDVWHHCDAWVVDGGEEPASSARVRGEDSGD